MLHTLSHLKQTLHTTWCSVWRTMCTSHAAKYDQLPFYFLITGLDAKFYVTHCVNSVPLKKFRDLNLWWFLLKPWIHHALLYQTTLHRHSCECRLWSVSSCLHTRLLPLNFRQRPKIVVEYCKTSLQLQTLALSAEPYILFIIYDKYGCMKLLHN